MGKSIPKRPDRWQAEIYRQASHEHLTAARELYETSRFLPANYLAGLAVECMLRAYRARVTHEFDSRHDLDKLYRIGLSDIVPPGQAEVAGAWLGEVRTLWSNDHRFLSEAALRKRWASSGRYKGLKGDFVKERNRQLLNAASNLIALGEARWKLL